MTDEQIIKILEPLGKKTSHQCAYLNLLFLAPKADINYDLDVEFGTNDKDYDPYALTASWNHFNQLLQPKSMLLTYFVRADALLAVKKQGLAVLQNLIAQDVTDNWQAQLLTKKTKPFMMQSIFLTNNNYPQLIIPGRALFSAGFYQQFDLLLPEYLKQFYDYYYVWQENNFWSYYQKEIVSLEPQMDLMALKKPITALFKNNIATLCYQAKKSAKDSQQIHYNVNQITYLTLADAIKNQTGISKPIAQLKNDPDYQKLFTYLVNRLNGTNKFD